MTRTFRSCGAAVVALAVIAGVAGFGLPSPAFAHEGGGTITVESSEPVDGAAVRYVARVIWNNDGHPAAAADTTMTAAPIGPDGTAVAPVTLEPVDDDGRFAATVEFPSPGAWTVRFTVITPAATLELPQQIDPPATTTTSAAPSTTTSERGSTTTTEVPVDEDSEASKAGTFVFLSVLVVLAGSAFVIARQVRRRHQHGAGSPGREGQP